ncbi:hypothetical protein CF327_g4670 [Tilletia walkeri]|nr:hypothetical protein CF327_g4670 [Tilletia walkeri]
MSPDTLRDCSAGDGLRRAVLVRNTMLANFRRVELQFAQQQQQQQQQRQRQLALQAAEHPDFTPVSYPWQQRPAAASQAHHVSSSAARAGEDIAFEGDLGSSSHSASASSPSSSTSSLPSTDVDEDEQAWFDDVLFELENTIDDVEDDLLGSVSSLHSTDDTARSTSSLELSTSLSDVPELIPDDEELGSGSSDEEDDDDDEAQHRSTASTPPSPTSGKLPPSSTRVLVHSPNANSASIGADIGSLSHGRFLSTYPCDDIEKARHGQQQLQQPPPHPIQDGMLHLLPPLFARPAGTTS